MSTRGRPPSVAIAAGGTGGHIFPGLALAEALVRARPDVRIVFVGTRRGLEGRLIPEAGHRLALVDMVPFAGRERARLPYALPRATLQCRRLLQTESTDVAVGMGGYAGIPLVVAARTAGVPSLVHESGAVAGRANRLAARFTPNIALAFDQAAASFRTPTRTVGMPLSADMAAFDRAALRPGARAELDLPPDVAMVLVNGGSQGSLRLNQAAVELAQRWKERSDVRLVVKAGRTHAEKVEKQLADGGGSAVARCVSFFDRIENAYAAADLTVCRAGAGTVAELAVSGLPAVLVPYPYAPDDHQAVNASVLVDVGAALMVRDDEAIADRLAPMVERLLNDRAELSRMGAAARGVSRPHAADELAAWVLELAAGRG
jgi:UDP-N-acetylglucosamine--N-acetylmuramyl-(pentapeptide) pyrophosphoryl-undecaprenol N-acetylglucosamine transferase